MIDESVHLQDSARQALPVAQDSFLEHFHRFAQFFPA